jgi:tRNA (cmo5U34)-methyltransferase
MAQYHWDPDSYLALMREEVPDYARLQDEAAAASRAVRARTILELGTGTGETARRLLVAHPHARLIGIDASPEMLAAARATLEADRVTLRVGRLEEPLPPRRFELVASVLCVHHLDGPGKAGLFARIAGVLVPGGVFVLGDVVVPPDPGDAVTPIDDDYDMPSTLGEQLGWLTAAGLEPRLCWQHRDLAVVSAHAPG